MAGENGFFKIDISLDEIRDWADDLRAQAEAVLEREAKNLAVMTYGHIIEQVQDKLHTSREKYLQHLKLNEVQRGAWMITLESGAMWIEEGMNKHEMIDDILNGGKSPYIAKDGTRYKIIPMQINKIPTQATAGVRALQQVVKQELKKMQIPYGKKELDENGQPRVGTLHRLSIMDRPIKTMEGVGQGHGPIGAVRQGTTGTPFLQGINIIQKNLTGPGNRIYTRRDILTFRVVSSKQKGSGKWIHPGFEAKHFFDEAYGWARTQWETVIKQKVLDEIQGPVGGA